MIYLKWKSYRMNIFDNPFTVEETTCAYQPSALMIITFCSRSIKGCIRQSRGSCFWVRQTPFWFVTIQFRSYSKPWFPIGHCITWRMQRKMELLFSQQTLSNILKNLTYMCICFQLITTVKYVYCLMYMAHFKAV